MINPALLVRLRKFKLKKFVKRGGKIKKLPAQKAPKQFMGTPAPSAELHSIGVKETILKAGRTTEKISFKRLLKKFPGQGVKAHKLAQLKGLKKVKALSERHGIKGITSIKDRPKTFYKSKKGSGLPKGMTSEGMLWAPKESSKGSKIIYAGKQAQQEKIFSSGKGYFDPKSQSFKWRPKKKR